MRYVNSYRAPVGGIQSLISDMIYKQDYNLSCITNTYIKTRMSSKNSHGVIQRNFHSPAYHNDDELSLFWPTSWISVTHENLM